MSIGKAVGEFSLTSTSVTTQMAEGGAITQINLEGTASGYGTVLGTLTFNADEPNAQNGTTYWVGASYLENGETLSGVADGVYESSGTHKWRIRSLMKTSDDKVVLTDGHISLEGRCYEGTMYEWE